MINHSDNPVEWALLLYELSDAHEHIGDLMDEMQKEGSIDSSDYRISIGHIYSHINRAWNSRNRIGDQNDESQYEADSQFPDDIEPT